MIKRFAVRVIALVLAVGMVVGNTYAAPNEVRLNINGVTLELDQPPVIENGRTLVPARAVMESLGLTVDYDGATQTVTGKSDRHDIVITINSTVAIVNGVARKLDVPARIVNGRTLVPVRFVAEALDFKVEWLNAERIVKIDSIKTLVVATSTEMTHQYIPAWTTNATDIRINDLLHRAYSTVVATRDDGFVWNDVVVKNHSKTVGEAGAITYTIELNEGLRFSDGSPITAVDYLCFALMWESPQYDEAYGTDYDDYWIVGSGEYSSGATEGHSGLRLLDDYTFSVTIDSREVTDDLAYVAFDPLPASVLLPDATITDTGNGAVINGSFTADTLYDSLESYLHEPTVTSGSYMFVSQDVSKGECVLERNPYFTTTHDGYTPDIDRVVVRYTTDGKTTLDSFAHGEVGVYCGVSDGIQVEHGMGYVEDKLLGSIVYPRAGYGNISFHLDTSPTFSPHVRKAIAHIIDRREFAYQFTGEHTETINGEYHLGQWEYLDNKEVLDSTLNPYEFDPAAAVKLLVADGWIYNENNQPFSRNDTVRYKRTDRGLLPLEIDMAVSDFNKVTDLIELLVVPQALEVGIRINLHYMPFSEVIDQYHSEYSDFSMFGFVTNFALVHRPWDYYTGGSDYNYTNTRDAELDGILQDMKESYGDREEWSANWLRFQQRWNQLLPLIPLYTSNSYDFYHPRLNNWHTDAFIGWSDAVERATID